VIASSYIIEAAFGLFVYILLCIIDGDPPRRG